MEYSVTIKEKKTKTKREERKWTGLQNALSEKKPNVDSVCGILPFEFRKKGY